jgi:hypothetical protein
VGDVLVLTGHAVAARSGRRAPATPQVCPGSGTPAILDDGAAA